MKRIVWLASYPKSGNTWLRIMLANLACTDTPVDINTLFLGGMASDRATFDRATLIESGLLTHDECDALRPRVYESLASGETGEDAEPDAAHVRYVKVHDAYVRNAHGEPLLGGARGANGAIVIVRDPRDIAASLAHHNDESLDDTIAFMLDDGAVFSGATDRQPLQLRQRLGAWSGHVTSWLDQTDIPIHVVRYEDMQADAAAVLRGVLRFCGHEASEPGIARAAAFATFAEVKRQEQASGFREAPRPDARNFFRRGEAGAWRGELTAAQAARIETDHAPAMQRLGYALSGAALSRTG